jgi:5-methyltetrahydropteroyltriglutamate--homocysteine methyltransferase
VNAGFILQVDDPGFAENWDAMEPSVTLDDYRAYIATSVEAANPRHEHEWKVWRDLVKLPEGKVLIPGVVTHATNVVEHPEVVADRIMRYAEVVGKENVLAGTDCGLGGRIHPSLAWAKLRALTEGAALASRYLWQN